MPTRKSLLAKGLTEEQIEALIEEGVEVTNPEPTIDEMKQDYEGAQKRIKELNKENEKYRKKAKELEELNTELKGKLDSFDEDLTNTKQEKDTKENELTQYKSRLEELEQAIKERDDLKARLESFEIKEQNQREKLLSNLPEEKREKFKNLDIEIIEEFINTPSNSLGIKKPALEQPKVQLETFEDRVKAPYISKTNKPKFIH